MKLQVGLAREANAETSSAGTGEEAITISAGLKASRKLRREFWGAVSLFLQKSNTSFHIVLFLNFVIRIDAHKLWSIHIVNFAQTHEILHSVFCQTLVPRFAGFSQLGTCAGTKPLSFTRCCMHKTRTMICIESHEVVRDQQIFYISVDLCLAKEYSDLTDDDTKAFWVKKMRQGQVLGIGRGPSCETWSAARHAPGGPSPIRSYDFPWGLLGSRANNGFRWKQEQNLSNSWWTSS